MSKRNSESFQIFLAAAVTVGVVMGFWQLTGGMTSYTAARLILTTLGFACFATLVETTRKPKART